MPERESDLTDIATVMGAHRMRHGWPPETLAAGVCIMPRRHQLRDPQTQELKGSEIYLEPLINDSREYYAHLALLNYREEDERSCRVCNGATVVRHGELVPGQAGFGLPSICPRWDAATKRCESTPRVDYQGFEVSR